MPDDHEIFKFLLCLTKIQTYQYILVDFLRKAYFKVDFGHAKISDAIFFGSIPTIKYYPYLMITYLVRWQLVQ